MKPNSLKSGLTAGGDSGPALEPNGLTPAVKAWLDTVIVPALVREFIASRKATSLVLSDISQDVVACTVGEKESEEKP